MIKSLVTDPKNKRAALIDESHALRVTHYPPDLVPPNTANRYRYFTALLGTTGADSGTTDMATTAAEYFISSNADYDLYITHILIVTADQNATHAQWGNIGVLTNGIDLVLTESGEGTTVINAAKTHGQALAQTGLFGYHTGGNNAQAFILINWTSTQDAQTILVPVGDIVPGGLRIGRGSKDKITLTTNDDVSGVDEMFARVIGYRHYPEETE